MAKQMSNSEIYTVYSKKNCSYCVRAVHLIENQGFKVQVKKIDEVLECHLMAGSADYLLKVVVGATEDYEQIHRKYLSRLPNVLNMTSSFSLRKVHKTTALPI